MATTTVVIGLLLFGLATLAGYLYVRRGQEWARLIVVVCGGAAILVNGLYLSWSVRTHGMVDTFRHNFESTLLLATLLGLVGLGTYLSRKLRGLDGLLFVLATLVQVGALLVMNRTGQASFNY